jgi:hypothetical protein
VKSQRGNHPLELGKKNHNRYGSHIRKESINNVFVNDEEQPVSAKNQYLRKANFSSINPLDTFIERNAIKNSAIDNIQGNRKIITQGLLQYNRRKKNMSTVVNTHNTNDLSHSFVDNLKNTKRLSPNNNRTRDNLSIMDDNSSIVFQNR